MKTRTLVVSCLLAFSLVTQFGCAHQGETRSSSSAPLGTLIEPVKDSRQVDRKAALTLPATVAILMAPGKQSDGIRLPDTTLRQAAEKLKKQLLANPKFIGSVAVATVEDTKGKISLEGLRASYAADIAVILSYQQDQRTGQSGAAGLMDAAIIGMFLVPGVETKTASVIDGMVVHIPSNAIIFRASGLDERSTHSTTHARKDTATEESISSLLAATTDFGNSLCKSLTKFENYDLSQAVPLSLQNTDISSNDAKGKPANDYWGSVNRYKSTGGGAFGLIPLFVSAAFACAAWRRR